MKVNIIAGFFPPEKGAAPSRLFKLAELLQQAGHDVEAMVPLANYPTGRIFNQYRHRFRVVETIGVIKTRRYWIYPTHSTNPFLRALNMISFSFSLFITWPYLRFVRKPDIIIVNSPPLLVGQMGIWLAKVSKAFKLVNISDVWPLTALEMGALKRGFTYNLLEKVEAYIYNNADAWSTQSEEAMAHLKKVAKQEKPGFLYRNLDKISPYAEEHPPFDSRVLKVVYAGLLGVAQGVWDICKHVDFKALGIEFHIYGHGHDHDLIANYIQKHPDCNIHLYPTIPKEEVAKMLAGYHATIVPLSTPIYGAFPSKVMMAAAAGLPVFFCGEGEGRKIVEQFQLGYTSSSGDFNALTENLRHFISSGSENFLLLKENCVNAAKTTFNFERQNQAFVQFLEGIYFENESH